MSKSWCFLIFSVLIITTKTYTNVQMSITSSNRPMLWNPTLSPPQREHTRETLMLKLLSEPGPGSTNSYQQHLLQCFGYWRRVFPPSSRKKGRKLLRNIADFIPALVSLELSRLSILVACISSSFTVKFISKCVLKKQHTKRRKASWFFQFCCCWATLKTQSHHVKNRHYLLYTYSIL